MALRRHVESLEKELAVLESQAAELAKEIEELTGEAPGIGNGVQNSPYKTAYNWRRAAMAGSS